MEALYRYARFEFECGKYQTASNLLGQFRALSGEQNAQQSTTALWGKLGSDILMQHWDDALLDLTNLKEWIDSKSGASPAEQLNQRAWLLHWSLFVYFNLASGASLLVDLFVQEKYMQAIQSVAPHLMRYLIAAAVLSPRRRTVMRDVTRHLERNDAATPVIISPTDKVSF